MVIRLDDHLARCCRLHLLCHSSWSSSSSFEGKETSLYVHSLSHNIIELDTDESELSWGNIVTLLASAISFILAQAAYYALSHRICTGTNARIDGSWIATLLETVSIGLIFAAWQMVTEDDWEVSPTRTSKEI